MVRLWETLEHPLCCCQPLDGFHDEEVYQHRYSLDSGLVSEARLPESNARSQVSHLIVPKPLFLDLEQGRRTALRQTGKALLI